MCSINRQSLILTKTDFHATKLNNDRNIYIYLPPSYDLEPDKRYPVLYMQDGQNIFNADTSSSGSSWRIHEVADKLISEGKIRELIIIGIEFKERTKEYSHYSCNKKKVEWKEYVYAHFEYSVEGKGELYEDFVINELKPYIDNNFRTLPDKDNTALMGASAGGFVTFNIGMRRPDIFGMLGIISPAFFGMDLDLISSFPKKPLKLWFQSGEKEPCLMDDTKRVVDLMKDKGYIEGEEVIYYQVPDGLHLDKEWGEKAAGPLCFFFGNVGEPIQAELVGRTMIGLEEDQVRINPVVYYNTGISRSDLNASYRVEDPEILEIKPDGTIIPKREGTTKVEYTLNNIRVSKEFSIKKGLLKTVRIHFEVKVPEYTPDDAMVGIDTFSPITLPLERVSKEIYRGTFRLPRGLNVNYKLKMLCKNQIEAEKDMDLQAIPPRHLYVSEDEEIYCIVINW